MSLLSRLPKDKASDERSSEEPGNDLYAQVLSHLIVDFPFTLLTICQRMI
jgi:hypothetical protein